MREHEYLLLEKAVASLTGRTERQRSIDEQRERNRTAPDRERLQRAIEELADVDVEGIAQAQAAERARTEGTTCGPARVAALRRQLADVDAHAQAHRKAAQARRWAPSVQATREARWTKHAIRTQATRGR